MKVFGDAIDETPVNVLTQKKSTLKENVTEYPENLVFQKKVEAIGLLKSPSISSEKDTLNNEPNFNVKHYMKPSIYNTNRYNFNI